MASFKLGEENELPINLEDLPNFKLKNTESEPVPAQGDEMATAKQFFKDLQNLLTAKKNPTAKDELLNLYDSSFNKISETVFKNSPWPTPQEIEESDDTFEFDINTILLYQELCYRHLYARVTTNFNQEIRVKSWENYLEIFRIMALDKEEINLPVLWIYDILDEFIYQFQNACQWRARIKAEDSLYQELINNPDATFWSLEEILVILRELIEKSQILKKKDDHYYLEDYGVNTRTIHYFGYFSLVSLLRLNLLMGKYEEALQIVDPIDFKKLTIYSKAYACYINLFYYAGFAYLMTGRYQETVKIFEALLSFINKYKQFYSRSFQFEAMNKNADKTLFLLAISLVFYPTQVEETLANQLKERLGDKLEKLNKYDLGMFSEAFGYGCPKFINPIKNMHEFKLMAFEKNIAEPINVQKEILMEKFKKIQNLNNISAVLKLYTKIPVGKAAKVLNTTVENLKEMLELYKLRNEANFKNTPFESTIIKRFVKTTRQMDFKIENDMIIVDEVVQSQDYSKVFAKQIQKIDEMMKELESY